MTSSGEVWQQIRAEAEAVQKLEPVLASFFHASVIHHRNLQQALGFYLATRLGCSTLPAMLLREVIDTALAAQPELLEFACNDIKAHRERDPACDQYLMPFIYFKGFHALQSHRIAHWLWHNDRQNVALFLQNRISTEFHVDIHPAAQIGSGVMIDHATGLVIGETAVVGDNVSMLHAVTLGGCGHHSGKRHPTVDSDVLISTGAKLLGDILIGRGAKIAAGSVVLDSVAAHTTVAGVPAKPVGRPSSISPAAEMRQDLPDKIQ